MNINCTSTLLIKVCQYIFCNVIFQVSLIIPSCSMWGSFIVLLPFLLHELCISIGIVYAEKFYLRVE